MARPRKANVLPERTRCVIYARVSTKEQQEEGYSIDAQLALLRSYALRNGFGVVREFVESESAKVSGRKAFGEMLALVRAEAVGAILAEKTDRLYRNLHDYQKIDDLKGVEVHMVKEGEVHKEGDNSDHRFMHGIKVLIARKYSENLSEEAKKGMLEKARQGIWPTKAPLGYLNVSVGSRRVIAPDPERAPLVASLFARYAAGGTSLKELGAVANGAGLRTRMGRRVAVSELHTLLQNPAYHGVVRWGGEEHPGVHEPLVDSATWQRAQEIMAGRNLGKEKPSAERKFTYKGLFRCGRCGCLISAQRTKGHVYYACTGAKGCPRKTVREEAVTEAIAVRLDSVAIRPEVLERLRLALAESLEAERALRQDDLPRLERERGDLRHRLERLYLDKVSGAVPDIVYPGLKAQWEARLEEVEAELRAGGLLPGKRRAP